MIFINYFISGIMGSFIIILTSKAVLGPMLQKRRKDDNS